MTAPGDYLVREDHTPCRARFPVIDSHNHLWGHWKRLDETVATLDAVGVVCYCDLTANVTVEWVEGGYRISAGDWAQFGADVARQHPGRFYGFTTATLAQPHDRPLFSDFAAFVDDTIETLRRDVARGARGLKVLKEFGLRHRDAEGRLIRVDDTRLAPIWDEAGRLGVPVLIHQSDPYGFFQPVTPENEHADTLRKYPDWDFSDRTRFPSKDELLRRRDALVAAHPETTFILPHVANWPENLGYVSDLLDRHPHVFIDLSARLDELGRQPYRARDFILRHADRILFGTDMPASTEMYRCHFRFFETADEYFIPPDYDGTFGRHRWRIHGLNLPDGILRKIYFENTIQIIPGLRDDLQSIGALP